MEINSFLGNLFSLNSAFDLINILVQCIFFEYFSGTLGITKTPLCKFSKIFQ